MWYFLHYFIPRGETSPAGEPVGLIRASWPDLGLAGDASRVLPWRRTVPAGALASANWLESAVSSTSPHGRRRGLWGGKDTPTRRQRASDDGNAMRDTGLGFGATYIAGPSLVFYASNAYKKMPR